MLKIRKDQKGVAMVIVLCLVAVIMMLSMALLLAASAMSGNANKSTAEEQARILAVSLADQFDLDLTNLVPSSDGSDAPEDPGGLWSYINREIKGGGWNYYDGETTGHRKEQAQRTLEVDSNDLKTQTGNILEGCEVSAYWEQSDITSDTGGTEAEEQLRGITVTLRVSCTVRGQTYRVTTTYEQSNDFTNKKDLNLYWTRTDREV